MKELNQIVTVLNKVINELVALRDELSTENTPTEVKEPVKTFTLEEVRRVLAELSRDGFTEQVRQLLQKYGAKKLSEVDSTKYENLIREAGDIRGE